MNCDGLTSKQIEASNERQREAAAMELAFMQIRSLPETTDCPEDELV